MQIGLFIILLTITITTVNDIGESCDVDEFGTFGSLLVLVLVALIAYFVAKLLMIPWNKATEEKCAFYDDQAMDYIQASNRYLNDNFAIFHSFQSKYWNIQSMIFLYDAIKSGRECGTWGQALNSLDAHLHRLKLENQTQYQTAIMEKTLREAQMAREAAEDAMWYAAGAARNSYYRGY